MQNSRRGKSKRRLCGGSAFELGLNTRFAVGFTRVLQGTGSLQSKTCGVVQPTLEAVSSQ